MNDFIVENIYENQPKKIKSKSKGKRGELELVEILNTKFKALLSKNPEWGSFSRSVGSGNRWGQRVHLSKTAQSIYSGDITCPDKFKFVIESKNGYDDVDLFTCFGGKCKQLDDFLAQVTKDAERVKKEPLLVWKKTRMPRIAFVHYIPSGKWQDTVMYYNNWCAVPFETLLNQSPNDFWFER